MKSCLFIIGCFLGPFQLDAQRDMHVILISIDGFRPEMYTDPSFPTPNLQLLVRRGTYADHMKSVFPSYTYPSHTAMLTGALPARSKIAYNQPHGSKGAWNWFTDSIKVPTLWQAIKQSGMTTAAVEWPVSVNAPITWNVPEIWSERYPDRITEARKYATRGLIEELEANATGKLDSVNMAESHFSMDENSARMAGYIFKKYKPNLLAVHFAEVDGMQHEYGRDHDSVILAIAAVDRCIGEILEAVELTGVKNSTTVIIVGDHGFSTIYQVFRPNMMIGDLSARFTTAGGSAFLYSQRNDSIPFIISKVKERLDRLPTEQRGLFRIIDRHELDLLGVDSLAIFALAAKPGLVFSGSTSGNSALFMAGHGGHHGYDPNLPDMYTGFIIAGSGIQKGGHIKDLHVTDIAPLISPLLGIEFKTPDAKFVPGIILEKVE